MASILVSLIGFYQLYLELEIVSEKGLDLYKLKSTFGHRNLWATFSVLSLAFLVFAFQYFKGFWKWLSALAILNTVFWIYFLESRSAWISLGVFVLFTALFWFFHIKRIKLSRFFSKVYGLVLCLGLGLAFFVYYHSANNKLQSQELGFDIPVGKESEKSFTVQERVLLWKGTGLMIQDNSLLGVGLGNWKIQFPKYGSDIWRARQGLVQFQRPHNDFLWVLSEQGILGLISYVFMFLVMFYFGFKNSENDKLSTNERAFNRILLAGILGYLSISLFSFPRERIAHQWVLYFSFSILIFYYFKNLKFKKAGVKAIFILPICLVLIFATASWIGWQRWQGEIFTKTILAYNSSGQWKNMAELSNRVKQLPFYSLDPSSVPISFYEGLANLNQQQNPEALKLFKEAEVAHPNMIHTINNIAAVYQFSGDSELAIKYYQKALTISPKYQDGILNLAAAFFNSNLVDLAYGVLIKHHSSFPEGDENYRAYTLVMLRVIQENTSERIQDEDLKNAVLQLNEDWLLQIHNKVILDSIKVDQRIIMDAIYGLEKLENTISTEQADHFRKAYLNN